MFSDHFLISPKFCKLLLMTGLFKLHIPTNRDLEPPLQLPRPGASSTTAETWSLLYNCRDLEPPLQLPRPGSEPPLQLLGRTAQSVGHRTHQRSWFQYRSGHILLFLLPLIQEGQLSVTGESMCTKYWLTAKEVIACPGKV